MSLCLLFTLHKNVPATVDGMLGGLAYVSPPDIEGSKIFLKEFLEVTILIGNSYN